MQTIQSQARNEFESVERRKRVTVALVIGTAAGALSYAFLARPGFSSDFFHVWAAARTLLDGGNPYKLIPPGPLNPGAAPSLYPLPALIVVAPLAYFDLAVAGALFIGISSVLLAYLLTRDGYHRLPLFMSAPFLMALSLGQWSPLLVAAALEPNLGFALAAKPNLGVAAWAYRPTVRSIIVSLTLTLVSLAVLPTWPIDWLTSISGRPEKFVPIVTAFGPILALGLIRWRTRDGRLFLALACVPQALFFYDQLLLWLLPRTLRQSLVLSLCSFGVLLTWYHRITPDDYYVQMAVPYALALYLPALALLLWPKPKASAERPPTVPTEASSATQPFS